MTAAVAALLAKSLDHSIDIQAELWSPDLSVKNADVTADLVPDGSVVSYASNSAVRHSAVLRWGGRNQWEANRVKLYATITNQETGESVKEPLGVYTIDRIDQTLGTDDAPYQTQCYDLTAGLDTPIGYTYAVDDGTTYVAAIGSLLDAYASWGRFTPADASVPTPAGYVRALPTTADTRAVVGSRVWPIGQTSTWRRVLDWLANAGGYRRAWLTRDGTLTIDEAPTTSTATFALPAGAATVVATRAVRSTDTWGTPNQWIVIVDAADPALPTPAAGTAALHTITDIAADLGPHSYRARGQRVIPRVVTLDAAAVSGDVDAGYTLGGATALAANRIAAEDRASAVRITCRMAPHPGLWHADVLAIPDYDLGDGTLWRVLDWQLPLDGRDMTVTAVTAPAAAD